MALILVGCATAPVEKGDTLPANPFTLRVQLASTSLMAGQTVDVTYTLTNITGDSVSGCAADWAGCFVWSQRAGRTSVIRTNQTCEGKDMFRVPPGATLTWTASVELPSVGVGPAKFEGWLDSIDGLWVGEVHSQAVDVTIDSAQ